MTSPVRSAAVVIPCDDLDATLEFFVDELGFRLERISPADAPRLAVVVGYGVRLQLDREAGGEAGTLRLTRSGAAGETTTAPNGTRIEWTPADPPLELPDLAPALVVSRQARATWGVGRAGMRYRDLVPDRQGGRFIASHIKIPEGGDVGDYVHFHVVRFQMIFCYRGWVEVVYEDQGAPFRLEAGDCVLQPPRIRHRVLRSSPGLEVIEITSPAEHDTYTDHELDLPNDRIDYERQFEGQRFVRHQAAHAHWVPWRQEGFECRRFGIENATDGLASASVVRSQGTGATGELMHDGELQLYFVTAGRATLHTGSITTDLEAGDAAAVPAGMSHALTECSKDLELLDVHVAWA